MPRRNNPQPREAPLRIGLVADSELLAQTAEALRRPSLQLVAQAGMRQADALPGVEWHDDARVLIAQSDIQAVVLAASTRINREMTRHALARGLHVWRTAPLARSFSQAAEETQLARSASVVYRVQSAWRHVAADIRWALSLSPAFRPHYSELRIARRGPLVQSWRSNEVESAGGVLANDAYAFLETWIAIRGLPENVTARISTLRRGAAEAVRETESVAIAMLREDDGGAGLIRATWDIEPFECELVFHGADASVRIVPGAVQVRLADQTQLDERSLPTDADRLSREIAQFEAAVRANDVSDGRGADPDLTLHLAITALLEAIYLSARTNQPETPKKYYEVQGWPEPA